MPARDYDPIETEVFSVYGFGLRIPNDWRVEFNPKGDRIKGDVAFHTPKKNRIFISWGPLEEANKRFKTVEEQRDWGVKQMEKSRGIKEVTISESKPINVCGHRALLSRIIATEGGGFLSPKQSDRVVNSMYLYCPNSSRYYVLYAVLNCPEEYPDFSKLFDTVAQSMVCHPSPEDNPRDD